MPTSMPSKDPDDDSLDAWLEWISESIRMIRAAALNVQRLIIDAVKKWLSANNRWLKILIIVVTTALVIVAVSVVGVYLGATAAQATLLGSMKNLTSAQSLALLLQVTRGAWSILVTLDERFRELEIAFVGSWKAVGNLIGLPIEFGAAFFSSYRALVFSLGAIAGFSPEELRVDWMTNVQKVLDTANLNMGKYAFNPGAVLDMLIDQVLRYDPEMVSQKTADELATIIQNTEDIGALGTNIQKAKDAIKGLQTSLPDEIEAAVEDQTTVIFDKMDEILDPISESLLQFEEIMLPGLELLLDDTETRLQEQIDEHVLTLAEIAETLGFDITDPEERLEFMQHYFGEMIAGDMFPAIPLMHISGVGWLGRTESNADPHDIFTRVDLESIPVGERRIESLSTDEWYSIVSVNQYSEVNPWVV